MNMLALFRFFLKCFINGRRMFWMVVLGFIPVIYVGLVYLLKPLVLGSDFSVSGIFPKFAFSMYLHFLLPLMAVFIGTSVIIDEVELATLPYLLVRPIPRWKIVLAKTLASDVLLTLILTVSLSISYILMGLDGKMNLVCGIGNFFSAFLVLILGSFTYVSLFTIVGGIIKKPVLTGLFFTFGWEKIVGSLPGSLRFTTIIHYLNSLFPFKDKMVNSDLFSLLRSTQTASSAWKAILILAVLTILFHYLAISLLSWKEFVQTEE
jgi:ABC-2 type transport system permease protein